MVSVLPRYTTGKIDASGLGLNERVVFTRRIAKVVKGGRHLRFNALVIVGDGQGVVGASLARPSPSQMLLERVTPWRRRA